jgi:DNA-binding transcriptional LysR family regulator
MSFELRQLRYFLAVAEELNFTRAAERLVMAQQPLSQAIKKLESDLGVALFERTTRRVELTEAGRTLLVEAREIVARAEAAAARTRRAAADTVEVGLSSAAYGDFATELIAAYRRLHPEHRFEVRSFDVTAPSAGVARRLVDLSLVREPIVAERVETVPLLREARVFVVASGNPLASRSRLSLTDVSDEPWIAAKQAEDGCDPDAWRRWWLVDPRPDGRAPRVGAEAATIDEWREHAAAGLGVSLCPSSAESYYARPGLAFVPAEDAEPATISLAYHCDDRERVAPLVATAQHLAAEHEAARSRLTLVG